MEDEYHPDWRARARNDFLESENRNLRDKLAGSWRSLEAISQRDPQSDTCGPYAPQVCENGCIGCIARSALSSLPRINGLSEFIDGSPEAAHHEISRDPTPYKCFDKDARKDEAILHLSEIGHLDDAQMREVATVQLALHFLRKIEACRAICKRMLANLSRLRFRAVPPQKERRTK